MKVFLTRPNHLLRVPTMAHCQDSRRALPHRERRTRAEPLFNCVLIPAPVTIRMRRQRWCIEVSQRLGDASALRSSGFFGLDRHPAVTAWTHGGVEAGLSRGALCCFLKSCVSACESELVMGSPQRGRDYLIQPALLIGWIGWVKGRFGLIRPGVKHRLTVMLSCFLQQK